MLSKSFKPAKCKTSLKLAVSRIKLLRNKRDMQIKQMRRELAQLIENGQEQTARIRVEHVIREEKTSAAYELIELFCELLAARIPIIESQKHCPVDLKEAVATVIFASPRCSDLPELMDIRKHFAAKYGKEFTNAALEIRPDCGVSRLVIEKLSARAPDIETKMKTLKAIAEDHNVKWDSKSFEDQLQKPHEDLLNGPTSFAGATRYHTEQYSANPSPDPKPTQVNASNINIPQTPISESRTSGGEVSRTNLGNAEFSSRNQTAHAMEFQNATSAAQAAAESAERARIAARAAARFASHENMSRQTSTLSNETPTYESKYEKPENLRVFLDEYSTKEPASPVNHELRSSQEVKPKVQDPHVHEQIERNPSNHFSSNSSPAASVNYELKSSQEVKPRVQNPYMHEQIQRNPSNYFSSNASQDFVNGDILDANFHKGHLNNVHLGSNSSKSKAEDSSPKTIKYDNANIKYDDDNIKYDDDVDSSKVELFYNVAKDRETLNSGILDNEKYEEDTFRRGASIRQSSFSNPPPVVFDNYNHVDEGSSSFVWRKNENISDTHLEEDSSNYNSSTSFNEKTSAESYAKPSSSRLHLFTESPAEEHSVPSLANVSPAPAFDASDEESSDIEDQAVHKNTPSPGSFSRKSSIESSFSDDKNSVQNQYVGETKEITKNDSRLYERKIEADPVRKYNFSSSDEAVHKNTPSPGSFSRKSSIGSSFSDDKNSVQNQTYVGETKEITKNDSRLYERKIEADPVRVNKYNFSSRDEAVHENTPSPGSFSRKSSIESSFSDDKNSIQNQTYVGETEEITKNDSRLYERKIEADPVRVNKYNFSSSDEEEPLPQLVTKMLPKEKPKSSEPSENLSDEKQGGINFGLLTGGLKHKSLPRPPYVKSSASVVPDFPIAKEQEPFPKAYASQSKTKYPYLHRPESGIDEHLQTPTQDSDYQRSEKKAYKEVNSSSLGAYSDSDDDNHHSSNTDTRKYNTSSRVNANVKHSRRTRDVIPATHTSSPKVAESKPEQPVYEESSKFKQVQTSYVEESSKSRPVRSLSGESPKSTGSISNEDPVKKASRTRPKLPPDYDTLAAHFQALRSNKR